MLLMLVLLLLLLPLLLVVPLLLRPPLLPPLPCMRRAVRYYIVFMCHFSCLSAHAHEHAHEPQTELHHTTHELTSQTGCSSRDTGFMPLTDAGGLETGVPRGLSLDVLLVIRVCCLPPHISSIRQHFARHV